MLNCYCIVWRKPEIRPEDGCYLLIREYDEQGDHRCEFASYEGGRFWYFTGNEQAPAIPENQITGWAYLPYDER